MSTIWLRNHDETTTEEVSDLHPFPTQTARERQRIRSRVFQVSVATTATPIVGENRDRHSIKITNLTGTQLIYIGFDNQVSASTGDYLHSAAGSNTTLYGTNAIFGIAATSAQTVTVLEEEWTDNNA